MSSGSDLERLESGENGAPGLTPGIRGSVVMLMVADGLYIRRLSPNV